MGSVGGRSGVQEGFAEGGEAHLEGMGFIRQRGLARRRNCVRRDERTLI